jgi:hypothetical protein
MEEQKTENTNWLTKELEETKNTAFDTERAPALKLEENKIAELTIDFSKPFEVWKDEATETIKKIIPVTHKGEKFVWWLNVKNPVYHQIVQKGVQGQTQFKVLQTGNKQTTKYALVE